MKKMNNNRVRNIIELSLIGMILITVLILTLYYNNRIETLNSNLISCNNQSEELLSENKKLNNQLQSSIEEYEYKISSLNNKLYEIEEKQQISEISIKSFETINGKVEINRAFKEAYEPTISCYMEAKYTTDMKVLPFEESGTLEVLKNYEYVHVLAEVYNNFGEHWAFVRNVFNAENGYLSLGYVPYEVLQEIEIEEINTPEYMFEGISIGDPIEKIITEFGRNYRIVSDTYYKAIEYGDISFGLDSRSDRVTSMVIYENRMSEEEYQNIVRKTEDGFTYNDKATDVLAFYDKKYNRIERLTDEEKEGFEPFVEYRLNDDFVLIIEMNKWDISDATIVESIIVVDNGWLY